MPTSQTHAKDAAKGDKFESSAVGKGQSMGNNLNHAKLKTKLICTVLQLAPTLSAVLLLLTGKNTHLDSQQKEEQQQLHQQQQQIKTAMATAITTATTKSW